MTKRLYVSNISWSTTNAELQAVFATDGRKVMDTHIVQDKENQRPRGYAFIEMESEEQAHAAIAALHGTLLDGRSLHVSEATARSNKGAPKPLPLKKGSPKKGPSIRDAGSK